VYLTKTLFAKTNKFTGCQRKMYYEMNDYHRTAELNETLQFYADNGKAIGALAKGYYPQGIEITETNPEKAYQETLLLLNQNSSLVLFEAAFIWNECYVRVDVLIKEEDKIKLIEVKSKNITLTKKGEPNSESKHLVMDLTFQFYVTTQALGNFDTILPFFYQIKKDYRAPVTYRSLFNFSQNRIFLKKPLSQGYLDAPILILMDASFLVQNTLTQEFKDHIQTLIEAMRENKKLDPLKLGKKCRDCEFKVAFEKHPNGFKECWQLTKYAGLNNNEFNNQSIFDIGFGTHVDDLIEKGNYRLVNAHSYFQNDLIINKKKLLHIKKLIDQDSSIWIDRQGIQNNLSQLVYPLYFLDFEAFPSLLPIFPYYRPNQKVIFQYSIHKIERLEEHEVISHAAQFIDLGSEDPTLDMIQSLKRDLGEAGSVFMYSSYENTCLNEVEDWLNNHPELEDKEELIKFIHTLTSREKNNRKGGDRKMIDLCKWIDDFYLDPATKGSNSIKKILPSMIQHSSYLQQKYGQKNFYGKYLSIKSLNFEDQIWLVKEGELYKNPYDLLSNPLEMNMSVIDALEEVSESLEIKNGGMAMIAYSKVQNDNLSKKKQDAYRDALLKYCELDTLAMVMVFQALFRL
jgi:hypothetical protein